MGTNSFQVSQALKYVAYIRVPHWGAKFDLTRLNTEIPFQIPKTPSHSSPSDINIPNVT